MLVLNEQLKELRIRIRMLGAHVFEETNFISYNGDVRPNIPKDIFDRYFVVEKSEDIETREKRLATLKTVIDMDYDEYPDCWIPLDTFLNSLDGLKLDTLSKELDSIENR